MSTNLTFTKKNSVIWLWPAIFLLLWACQPNPAITQPDLPGTIIIYHATEKQFLQYTPTAAESFTPVSGYSLEELAPIDYDPGKSPDGQWDIAFDQDKRRFVVTGPTAVYVIENHILSLGDVDWSPDSQYLIYSANDQQGEWASRITVLSLKDGTQFWLGTGIFPRWFP